MKRVLLSLLFLSLAASASAANYVSQAVFSITSSAKTTNTNLRVQPMGPKTIGRDENSQMLQTFLRQAGTTQNLFLTKSTTVDLSTALCLYIEVDQQTKMYLNSETAYITLPAGAREVQCFK